MMYLRNPSTSSSDQPINRKHAYFLAGFSGFFFVDALRGLGGVLSILRSTSSVLGEKRRGRRSGLLMGCSRGY